VKLIKYENMN